METYVETFFESHVWDTNWKVLAENFMESYHLPVCHAATIGGLSKLDEMVCPPGLEAFNYHTILKDETLKIAIAHPSNTRLEGERRRTTFLLAIYPSLLITLTPGYFWYLTLHPQGPGQVRIGFGGGMSPDFVNDPDAQAHFTALKTLLDEVNVEDRGCTEKVYRGLSVEARAARAPQPPRAAELRLRPLSRQPRSRGLSKLPGGSSGGILSQHSADFVEKVEHRPSLSLEEDFCSLNVIFLE